MLLKINFESDMPIYSQLKNQIIEGIATNKLKPGEYLPSVRQLANDLGINMHTVKKTYDQLKQDGFILVHRQKGVVVNPSKGPQISDEYLESLKEELKPLVTEAYCRGMGKEDFERLCNEVFISLERQGGNNL